MAATASVERFTPGTASRGCRLVVRRSDDPALHPHDLYISRIAERLRQSARPEWLDVGCGWHLDWKWELERERSICSSANLIGIDPDWQAISRHRTITARIVGTVEALPFASQSFDLATANVVVEHLKYPALAFGEIYRVLRPGGWFLFRTPSAHSYFVRIAQRLPQNLKVFLASKVIENREPEDIYPAHYRANTAEVIHEICTLIGFREVNVTITKVRGILSRVPALARAERRVAAGLGMNEGSLIVEVRK